MRRVILLAALAAVSGFSSQAPRLQASKAAFLLDGKPIQIISGEMHYARVPREYWRDRLLKARAMGLNTISTYVFWNFHEAVEGTYDFTGQRDIAAYIRTAQEVGLHVILRPGPYVCAEWELGGYPAWLFATDGIVLRSTDQRFTRPAARWLDRLSRELAPLLSSRGGPIIAVQVENEYGSFGSDKDYMTWQRDALTHAGFRDVLLYTADGDVQLPKGTLPDLPAVVNFGAGGAEGSFTRLQAFRPDGPMMSGEYWAGWFDQWGLAHHTTNTAQQTRELTWMLDRGYSVNLYMFHGGTTFGFMNGANVDRGKYRPQTTSYDYDAALDESGRPTPKYFAFRDAIAKRTGATPPAVPPSPDAVAIPSISLDEMSPLWPQLKSPVHLDRPRPMETLAQSYGYIVYRTTLPRAVHGDLAIHDLRDYAQIYLNGVLAGTLDRRLDQSTLAIDVPTPGTRLDILVENSGRVNFAMPLRDERKGITSSVTFAGDELTGWDVFRLPLSSVPEIRNAAPAADGPAFYRGHFSLTEIGDTFLDTRGWGKGTVWINGHHLGRFWDIGPQQTLYVPGPWLKRGANEIVVFDLAVPSKRTMAGLAKPVFELPTR